MLDKQRDIDAVVLSIPDHQPENLLATSDKAGARQIYRRLHESRTHAAERFVKEAAAKGLAVVK